MSSAALLVGLLLSCTKVEEQPVDGVASLHSQHDLGADLRGLSGLAAHDDGWLAVEERGLRLVRIGGGDSPRVLDKRPLQNIPEGLDLESATVQGRQLVIGTEASGARRDADLLLTLDLGASSATVVERRELRYGHFGLAAPSNKGLEAVCATDAELFVGAEPADTEDKRRRAPAWRIQGDTVVPLWLGLTSREGKLAALACDPRPDGSTVLWGIERHYETRRVVRWTAPPMARWLQELPPEAVWDLDPALAGRPNPEGLALVSSGAGGTHLVVVVDNDHGGETGSSTLYRVELAPIPGAR